MTTNTEAPPAPKMQRADHTAVLFHMTEDERERLDRDRGNVPRARHVREVLFGPRQRSQRTVNVGGVIPHVDEAAT